MFCFVFLNKVSERNLKNSVQNVDPAITLSTQSWAYIYKAIDREVSGLECLGVFCCFIFVFLGNFSVFFLFKVILVLKGTEYSVLPLTELLA